LPFAIDPFGEGAAKKGAGDRLAHRVHEPERLAAAKIPAVRRRVEPFVVHAIATPARIDDTLDHGGNLGFRSLNQRLATRTGRRLSLRGTQAGDEPTLPSERRVGPDPPAEIARCGVQTVAGRFHEVHLDVRVHSASPAA
jgi:hypothetical protein